MSVLWKKIKQAEGPSKLQEIEAGGVKLDRPTVIFLTGVFTTADHPQYVSGAISHLNEMLDSFGQDNSSHTDVMAWSYKSHKNNIKNVFAYNAMPEKYYSKQSRQFVYDFLLPHIASEYSFDKKGQLTGKPRKNAEVVAAFQNLTFLAYSYGSVFSQEVYHALSKTMNELGYSEKNTKFLISRIHQVSLGAVSRPMKEDGRYTSICLVATNDRISTHKRRLWWSTREMFASYTKNLSIRKLGKRNWYISAPVQKELWEPKEDKDGNIVMRNVIRPLFPKWWVRQSHHELQHYTTDRDDSNQFAKIARFALINCVKRDRALRPAEITAPPKCLQNNKNMDQECKTYASRIRKAMRR